jgi:hypothetical protein
MSGAPSREVLERADALFQGVFAPLVIGGALLPIRPLGPSTGLTTATHGEAVFARGDELTNRVQIARVRVARALFPLDRLPAPTVDEWRLVASLNDLLQVTNPTLPGVLASDRPEKLLALVRRTLAEIPAPTTVGACLERHTTLSRCLTIVRQDTHVRWWSGAESFLGQEPPSRLLAWPERRKVQVQRQSVSLTDLPTGEALRQAFREALTALLSHSPLTDLATAHREFPAFVWSEAALALIAPGSRGAALARRAIPAATRADVALERACAVLPTASRERVHTFLAQSRKHASLSP